MVQTVLVTGATGYIALHIVNELLKAGFAVIGTVRSAEKGKLLDNFKTLYPDSKLTLEFVADIAQLDAFDEVVKKHPEIDFILHTASPFSFGLGENNEDVFVKPAKNGTIGILNAAKNYAPNVKHVVVTSSLAAVMDYDHLKDHSYVHTEESWNPMDWETAKTNPAYAYCFSKTIAEKSARDFIKTEKPNFTLSTVNPVYVFGPQMFEETAGNLNTSSDLVNSVLNLAPDAKGPFNEPSGGGIDVRDVARAHLISIQDPVKFNDARLVMVCGKQNPQKFLDILNARIPELRGKIPVGDSAAGAKYIEENVLTYDFSKSEALFGQKYITLEDSVVETAKQVLDYKKTHQ
ncbi:unnamed protein product [Kuraishia capsulata CBS 1993]|uniref:NAD-dependent epimerase/dehydratase domain-containing protein n=1 Tax=Kuraishia capsulata CBS 1993 TaxID=1382522 RepID=W6MIR0_9ASCO|nr:uncharacterized protein KUCA_T00001793001 [Kuraishia capsulata CBS 1993]CDK25823.1 unnamed protein product [Kuraishia capsulata CBS 1993]